MKKQEKEIYAKEHSGIAKKDKNRSLAKDLLGDNAYERLMKINSNKRVKK